MVKVAAQISGSDMDSKKLIAWAQHPPAAYTLVGSSQTNPRFKESFDAQEREHLASMFGEESVKPTRSPFVSLNRGLSSIKERGQLLVKTVAGAFEKVDGERSKCPRCKGAGLLNVKPWWKISFRQASEDPCWFCLGVGVMPVLDLSGLLVARNPPMFKTKDIIPYRSPRLFFQSYIGKYPASRCRFSCYRLSKQLKQSLTLVSPSPSAAHLGNENERIDNSHAVSKTVSLPDPMPKQDSLSSSGVYKSSVLPSIMDKMPKFSSSYKNSRQNTQYDDDIYRENMTIPHISTNSLFDHHSASEPSFSQPNTNLHSGNHVSPLDRSHSTENSFHKSKSQTQLSGSAESEAPMTSYQYQGTSSLRNNTINNSRRYFSNNSSTSSPSPSPPGSPHRGHRRWNEVREEGQRGRYTGEVISPPRSPSGSMESPRSRSPRRERNRIREKAERDAVERARRLKRPFSPRTSSSVSASSSPRESRNGIASDPSMNFSSEINPITFWKAEIDARRNALANGTNIDLTTSSSTRGSTNSNSNSSSSDPIVSSPKAR